MNRPTRPSTDFEMFPADPPVNPARWSLQASTSGNGFAPMKVQVEIAEEAIQSAIARQVCAAVADQANLWIADRYIREEIKARWKDAVDRLIDEALGNSEELRAKIANEIERKLRAQVAAAMKAAATA